MFFLLDRKGCVQKRLVRTVCILAMVRRRLAGGAVFWFSFLAVSERGQRGEVVSEEKDEQWLFKGSQGA